MEDPNMLAADCIVISCCCQCLILQILIFVLLKLPCKLLRKTKEYARKLRARRRRPGAAQAARTGYGEAGLGSVGSSFRVDSRDFSRVDSLEFGCCMGEIESVLGELSSRGEFAFGSFWGGEVSSCRSFRSCVREEVQVDYDSVRCRLVELFGSSANFDCR